MNEHTDATTSSGSPADSSESGNAQPANRLDPAFFTCINEYLELANRQAKQQGLKRTSMATLYAAARFNSHVYLAHAKDQAGDERTAFLDYMTALYRRMLNEGLDGLGAERDIDVGESELAVEMAAASAGAKTE